MEILRKIETIVWIIAGIMSIFMVGLVFGFYHGWKAAHKTRDEREFDFDRKPTINE